MTTPSKLEDGGPDIPGTRLTVYDLLPYFLDPTATESYMCRVLGLTAEQVAAARAYVLGNPETVLTRHLEIEERIAAGNPPEILAKLEVTRAAFRRFKDWLDRRRQSAERVLGASLPIPSFREWLADPSRLP